MVATDVLKPSSASLVTLRKNGSKQGMTQYYCDNEISKEADFLNLAIKSLAGKASVKMVYGQFNMGASEDIQAAAGYIRQWIEFFERLVFSGIVCDQQAASETILAQNEKLAAAKLEVLYGRHKPFFETIVIPCWLSRKPCQSGKRCSGVISPQFRAVSNHPL